MYLCACIHAHSHTLGRYTENVILSFFKENYYMHYHNRVIVLATCIIIHVATRKHLLKISINYEALTLIFLGNLEMFGPVLNSGTNDGMDTVCIRFMNF